MSDVERRLLSTLFTQPGRTEKVAALLRPDEFTVPMHREIFRVMTETLSRGREFDEATVLERLRQQGAPMQEASSALLGVLTEYSNPGCWQEYVDAVQAEALWARTSGAAALLADSCRVRDLAGRQQALDLLAEHPGGGWEDSMESLQDAVWSRLNGEHGVYLPLPFRGLNVALQGGLSPGEVTVIGGWTSHCKSTLAMQAADSLVTGGGDALYLTNEMRRDELALRVMAGHGGPPLGTLRAGQVTDAQARKLVPALQRVALKIVDAATRTCEEICAYIVARRPQLAVLDLFNRLPRFGGGTPELDEQVNRICDAAARSQAHVLLVSQLNRGRLSASKELPHPTLGDLRDTGSLATHAANVLFVYLVEKDGIRQGFVEVGKARNGIVGASVDVTLNPGTMRLVQTV